MTFKVGQHADFSKTICEADVYNFAGICGDFNSVHINKIEAEKSIFGKQVAHGMLCASLISTVLGMKLPGPGTIYMGQELTFCAPVYIGDTISATVEIKELLPKGNAILDTVVKNQNGLVVIKGNAKVKLPSSDVVQGT